MNRPTLRKAAWTSALLSVVFMVVYSLCNWLTTRRHDVGIWYYDWERIIPFVPLMIVPYMSIDLFYVAAPFLCKSEAELRTFSKRILLAIFIAGACFLALPLQMAGTRPEPAGWTAGIFRFLHGFDQPHNLFPSLHIALRTILAELYGRHTRGWTRWSSHIWFSLIGVSTLLTYQHHVADVLGGFVVALICFYAIPDNRTKMPVTPNRRVAAFYGAAAIVCILIVSFASGWALLASWPALSLGLTALAYCGLGPGLYRKQNGRLPLSTRILFAPVLLGQQLSLCYYRRQCSAWNVITPHVWMGSKLSAKAAAEAQRQGVTAVLDLTSEFSEAAPFQKLNYRNLQILDLTGFNPEQLQAAAAFIENESKRGIVYVHCKIGYSRSAAAVGAYLLSSGEAQTADEAIALIRHRRPGVIVRPEAFTSLEQFAATENLLDRGSNACPVVSS